MTVDNSFLDIMKDFKSHVYVLSGFEPGGQVTARAKTKAIAHPIVLIRQELLIV